MLTARYKLIFLINVNNAGVFMEEGNTQLPSVSTLDSAQVTSDSCKVILTNICISNSVKLDIKIHHLQHGVCDFVTGVVQKHLCMAQATDVY